MRVLLDTCILIDVLRRQAAATALLQGLSEPPALSVATIAELRAGERGARDRHAIETLLANSSLLDIDQAIAEIAGGFLQQFQKSHALDFPDAAIAATAVHHGLELVTLNLKHFPMFPGLQRPY